MAYNPYPYGDPRYFQIKQLEEAERANELAEKQNRLLEEQTSEIEQASLERERLWLRSATPEQRAEWAREHYRVFRLDQPLQVSLNKFAPSYRALMLSDRELFAKDPWTYHLLSLARSRPGSAQHREYRWALDEQKQYEKQRRRRSGVSRRPTLRSGSREYLKAFAIVIGGCIVAAVVMFSVLKLFHGF